MSLAPSGGVKLVEGGDVGGASHVEALGVVVDGVSALQPHDSVLLTGESTSVLAAEHVLDKETALRPAARSWSYYNFCQGWVDHQSFFMNRSTCFRDGLQYQTYETNFQILCLTSKQSDIAAVPSNETAAEYR